MMFKKFFSLYILIVLILCSIVYADDVVQSDDYSNSILGEPSHIGGTIRVEALDSIYRGISNIWYEVV